jgi:hypothetical protein
MKILSLIPNLSLPERRNNMARTRTYEQLARLKQQKKEVEEKIKEIEKKIISKSPLAEITTKYGKLCLQKRSNRSIPDNKLLIKKSPITQEIFFAKATISASTVKGIVGDINFQELIKEGVIKEKEPTRFYKLTALPKNQEQL